MSACCINDADNHPTAMIVFAYIQVKRYIDYSTVRGDRSVILQIRNFADLDLPLAVNRAAGEGDCHWHIFTMAVSLE